MSKVNAVSTEDLRSNSKQILDKFSIECSDESLFDLILDDNGMRLSAEEILPSAQEHSEIKFKFRDMTVRLDTVEAFVNRLEV